MKHISQLIPQAFRLFAGIVFALYMSFAVQAGEEKSFLPVEQAFPFSYQLVSDADTDADTGADGRALQVTFDTAEGYYLYHKRFSFKTNSDSLVMGQPRYSIAAEQKQDPNFGDVKVYHRLLTITVPYTGQGEAKIRFQGCSDDGLCYLPQTKKLDLAAAQSVELSKPVSVSLDSSLASDTQGLSELLKNASLLQALGLFFLLGLGLSLTPCVLPMIPILSSIIGGQGEGMTGWKGFRISLAYVLGMATSYALAGVLTATLGQGLNLQVAMQQTWVLTLFAALFVLLALSMFGFYELQLPSRIQVALNSQSQRLTGGKVITVFVMGAVSALVVSPCISAPLAGALLYVSTTQDWVLGGATLFTLALGMGVPLVVIGTSGGKFLPSSGPWMVKVKQCFGVMLLAVAILLVSRFAAPWATLGLWALLLIGSAIHFGALEAAQSGWQRTTKSLSFITLVYGVILLVGMLTGADDPLDPLGPLSRGVPASQAAPTSLFTKVTAVAELERGIENLDPRQSVTMVDLYADWCASCKVMDKNVFQDSEVMAKMATFNSLKFDVTANTDEQAAWLSARDLFGPPGILFFDSQGNEIKPLRVVGELDKQQFLAHIAKISQQG